MKQVPAVPKVGIICCLKSANLLGKEKGRKAITQTLYFVAHFIKNLLKNRLSLQRERERESMQSGWVREYERERAKE